MVDLLYYNNYYIILYIDLLYYNTVD